MRFRTELKPQALGTNIQHQDELLSLGSCFASNISQHLLRLRYRMCENPFGIVYNPLSIAAGLHLLCTETDVLASDLVQHEGLWHDMRFHGSFSQPEAEQALQGMNQSLAEARASLRRSQFLIITLGTAYVYQYKKTGQVVANCHRLPDSDFERQRLSPKAVFDALSQAILQVRAINPSIKVLYTLSPVRHLRDGFHENQLSKAALLLGIEQLCRLPQSYYFPAYELVLDDLRDYRFYKSDMLHPSEQAVEYVWSHFEQACLDASQQPLRDKIDKYQRMAEHRPLHPNRAAHEAQQQVLERQWAAILQEAPWLK